MTFEQLQKLREKRKRITEEARRSYEDAAKAGRSLQGEELEKFNRQIADAEAVGAEIESLERLDAQERSLLSAAGEPVETRSRETAVVGDPEKRAKRIGELRSKKQNLWLAGGPQAVRDGFSDAEQAEIRALQADVDTSGGYLYPDEQFVNRLIKAVDDNVMIRQWATVIPVGNADSLGVPSLDTDPDDWNWTTELQTGSEDSSMAVGKRELRPSPLAKRIKISNKLIEKSVTPVESLVIQRLAYKLGITQEKAFLTGTAANQPQGLFVASANGINTDRDVSTDNTTTALTLDGLKNARWTLKPQYWPKAKWLFHRTAGKMLAKIKDGEGRYLWQQSVTMGQPDMLDGVPVYFNENVPSTFTAGLYVGMLGDFSHYWIADSHSMRIQRLGELYAETNQIGFIGRLETDGMPVLSEAFVRVTLAP